MTSMHDETLQITAQQRRDLEVARTLAENGVPIFLAEPDPKSKLGYRLPKGWQHTTPDSTAVDRWKPGMAVCAVMGTVVDALDIDPRNDGDSSYEKVRNIWPEVYGSQSTPNGGRHDLVAPLGIGSPTSALDGIDVRGGKTDGSGRGFIFIPPTERRHGPYRWDKVPDLPARVADDATGQWLARRLQPTPADGTIHPPDRIPVGRRHTTLVDYASRLRHQGVPREQAREEIRELHSRCEQPKRREFPIERADEVVDDIYRRYPANRTKSPPAVLLEILERDYTLHRGPDGDPFVVPRGSGVASILSPQELGGQLSDAYYSQTGSVVSEGAIKDALRVAAHRARKDGAQGVMHLRAARTSEAVVFDLGQPANSRCVVVTAEGWTIEEVPPQGVHFRRTPAVRPLPDPVGPGTLDPLRQLLGFGPEDERWLLIQGWLVAGVFADTPRPMLMFVGPPGSAKTTRARLVVNVLDPRGELGSAFGRNLRDDITKAQARYLVSYDNITKVNDEVSDHLCRLVTGDEIDQRSLYTNSDLVTLSYRRTGVITAVSLPLLRPDALERVIIIRTDRISEDERQSESAIEAAFQQAHSQLLAGVMDQVVTTLANLPGVQSQQVARLRMADYFDLQGAIDEQVAEAYRYAVANLMEDAALADPLVTTIKEFLHDQPDGTWRGTMTEAWQEAGRYRDGYADSFTPAWWPTNAQAFSRALERCSETLRALGITYERRRTKKASMLTLRLSD